MATLAAYAPGRTPELVPLSTAQAGNGVSTNIADRGPSHKGGIVRINAAAGATPTCTYLIEVSADGVVWTAATYADIATPTVNSTATFVITTTSTVQKIVKQPAPWRYLRVTYSANTNVTNTTELLYDDTQTPPWS
ncbi:hypothetical protein AB0N38_18865 [Micromonospora aurantiaca]|uniref:Discoidin domain-containing protein n=1 Tax=Micromonospora aurantiaca (nom. illeg.) TaxID=47850 RepID=A0A6N3JSP2_9ACTN|nr:hypothetical protein [Micromonospora aurantiaca]AXH88788.1 hypothetical protein DVH21_01955 [Micromonospora aurantiaca]KAB1111958.1 hypothetical protein F6X54_15905 [Micromonospora aurantiaca]MBC9003686.1 hypothetical protein [Micromonospora aurantiaca]